jgi:lipopolysaccharide/colanic/teichoic acid biosynthesis glycosyltransferase
LFDIAVASGAAVALAPPLLLIALAVALEGGRPVIFHQERVGFNGRIFRLYKFRTMRPVTESDATVWSIAGDPRIGPVGQFLRATSLDELPQLWNIIRGDMSLVGPRPERPTIAARYSADPEGSWARYRVPAGLTGLAQIETLHGDTSIADRVRYDNYYVANWSLRLDVKIIMLTLRELLRHSRI